MTKKIFILLLLITSYSFYGQKYSTKIGTLQFEASVPSFEEVAAENKSVSAVLDPSSGNIAVLALVKAFRFKVALMEEHFNENYAESSQYPKATFKGKIENFDLSKIDKSKAYSITGELTFHGKTKTITTEAKISKSGNTLLLVGSFDLKPEEFDIEIPKLVRSKVASKIKVSYNLSLTNP